MERAPARSSPGDYLQIISPVTKRMMVGTYGFYVRNVHTSIALLEQPITAQKHFVVTPRYMFVNVPPVGLSLLTNQEIGVFALVAGVNHRVAAFGYRGGSLFERRDFSMAGALVRHPQGDLLIDTGFGGHIDEQFRTLPFMVRAVTFYSLWRPAADQLKDVGYDHISLRAILLTHRIGTTSADVQIFPACRCG